VPNRSLDDLHPWVKAKAERFLEKCRGGGFPVLIYETWRSPEDQNARFGEGKSDARAWESPHQYGLAFDCVPFAEGGLVAWWEAPDKVWSYLYSMAAACGLDPLGDIYGEYLPWDKGHFQEPGWRLVKDLLPKRIN